MSIKDIINSKRRDYHKRRCSEDPIYERIYQKVLSKPNIYDKLTDNGVQKLLEIADFIPIKYGKELKKELSCYREIQIMEKHFNKMLEKA